ncbi:hypothetical protein PLUA15_280041 [Pseudomonas lundensis]|uniref:Uncharacterized protein n=1 Tax=Pseudomonas lundensis TaxID=86185 RepID=A0AAX2H894_9PSED|nr:hypothetical protein PLUA15_280041 [Pseudomonas lundensis]
MSKTCLPNVFLPPLKAIGRKRFWRKSTVEFIDEKRAPFKPAGHLSITGRLRTIPPLNFHILSASYDQYCFHERNSRRHCRPAFPRPGSCGPRSSQRTDRAHSERLFQA